MSSTAAVSPERVADTKGPTIVVVNCVVTAISTAFVFARLYVRVGMMKKFQLDDFFIVLSLVSEKCRTLANYLVSLLTKI